MARAGVALWRIAKHTADYAATDLGGGGARVTGGRWNGRGIPVVYAATTVPEEYNVLINPLHPQAGKLATTVVRQYVYDPRL